jgi:hypothetical protein
VWGQKEGSVSERAFDIHGLIIMACQQLSRQLHPPARRELHARFFNQTIRASASPPAQPRRVWDAIVFGFELPMLRLHMKTLDALVDGFLVTESTICFQTRKRKEAHLTKALASGQIAPHLARRTFVKVLTEADEHAAGCDRGAHKATAAGYSTRCFQAIQRHALINLLFGVHAGADDLAIVADVDEIATPSVVQLLRECAPFPSLQGGGGGSGNELRSTAMIDMQVPFASIVLVSRQKKYGAHCDAGETWNDGPHVFLVGALRRFVVESTLESDREGGPKDAETHTPASREAVRTSRRAQKARMRARARRVDAARMRHYEAAKAFDRLRTPAFSGRNTSVRDYGPLDVPWMEHGGWHLTSWGEPSEVVRKLTTFGAANRFGEVSSSSDGGDTGVFNLERIAACASTCTELIVEVRHKANRSAYAHGQCPSCAWVVTRYATPCHRVGRAPRWLVRMATPAGKRLWLEPPPSTPGPDLRPRNATHLDRIHELVRLPQNAAQLDLPPYLLSHLHEFPPSWFAHLQVKQPVQGPVPVVQG